MQFGGFGLFTGLCKDHHYLILEIFITPKKNLMPVADTTFLSSTPGNSIYLPLCLYGFAYVGRLI